MILRGLHYGCLVSLALWCVLYCLLTAGCAAARSITPHQWSY